MNRHREIAGMMRAPVVAGFRVFEDSFTDLDNTLLVDHTPDIDVDGTGWDNCEYNENIIVGNLARGIINGIRCRNCHIFSSGILVFAAEWVVEQVDHTTHYVCVVSDNSGFEFYLKYNPSTDIIEIYENDILKDSEGGFDLEDNVLFTTTMKPDGAKVIVQFIVGGVPIYTYTSESDFTGLKMIGVGAHNNNNLYDKGGFHSLIVDNNGTI